MTSKLKSLPMFKDMHIAKDPIKLLKAIKALTFKFDNEKEYEMSLVEAIDKLYQVQQTKDMTNIDFLHKFNNLVDVIEHYGGTIGVHRKITNDLLAKHIGGVYDETKIYRCSNPASCGGRKRKDVSKDVFKQSGSRTIRRDAYKVTQ